MFAVIPTFTCQNSHWKFFTLKTKAKVTEYNIRNVPTRWQIPNCINVIFENFSPALTVFEIFTV